MLFRVTILIVVLALYGPGQSMLRAQSPVFSQYYSAGLYLNPALAGVEKNVFLGMNYRSQWTNANLPFKTFQLSFIQPIIHEGIRTKHLGGWGLALLNDQAGPNQEFVTKSLALSGTYNIHFNSFDNQVFSVSGQFALTQQKLNTDAFRWSSQYSPLYGYDPTMSGENGLSDQVLAPVVNVGLLYSHSFDKNPLYPISMFHGLSVANINRPKAFMMDRSLSSMLYKFHGGMSMHLDTKIEIAPSYLIIFQEQTQINFGTYVSYPLSDLLSTAPLESKITAGSWYRVQDAFIFSFGVITNKWNAAFSYDTNSQSLKRNFGNANAFEFSMAYKVNKLKGYKKFSSPLI
jgi:type IX secretion system PorP/SprF family membrane protein